MAAAYAALLSLSHTIKLLENRPISLDETQIKSLSKNTTFLLNFLENNSISDGQEAHIADAAYKAEDILESYIIDRGMIYCFITCFRDLFGSTGPEKVMENMNLIAKVAEKMMTRIEEDGDDDELHKNCTTVARSSSRSLPSKNILVGFDDLIYELKDKLTNLGRQPNLQVIPVVGMGGSGKTALAIGIYEDPLIVQYFDIRIWVTISQKCSRREILVQSLLCLKQLSSREYLSEKSEFELGQFLFESLFGRRYLVVIDDLWAVEAWDGVSFFFPDVSNGSKIVVTTRLTNVALSMADSCDVVNMRFLDEDNSRNLFSRIVFGEESFPHKFKETGERITKSCRGLPLSIKVIGGLLSKHKKSCKFWEYVSENFNKVLNSEDDERCSKILRLSFNELPIHLKPCFLYMGVFREDCVIPKSTLVRLWVAEGFVKPISGKSLEIVAEEYLRELVDRNLILVQHLGSTGKIKYCKIHDLLRDLCVNEAGKNKFLHIIEAKENWHSPVKIERRTIFHSSVFGDHYIKPLLSSSLRSLICDLRKGAIELRHLNFKCMKVLKVSYSPHLVPEEKDSMRSIPTNLRLLDFDCEKHPLATSIIHLWNLPRRRAIIDIWKMPRLRHAKCQGMDLPSLLNDFLVVLDNLETLKGVGNFECSEEVVKRIPNMKKLGLQYLENGRGWRSWSRGRDCYCLDNLCRLHKLESLAIIFKGPLNMASSNSLRYIRPIELGWSLRVPISLKKLSLWCIKSDWDEIGTKIGSLPELQVLKLIYCRLGPQWETVEGRFEQLNYLHVGCDDLNVWRTDSTHFPRLEQLVLDTLSRLEEIPREIGDIPTLKSIHVSNCSKAALASAEVIKQEQRDIGNEDLQVFYRDDDKYLREFSNERSEMEQQKLEQMRERFERHAQLAAEMHNQHQQLLHQLMHNQHQQLLHEQMQIQQWNQQMQQMMFMT